VLETSVRVRRVIYNPQHPVPIYTLQWQGKEEVLLTFKFKIWHRRFGINFLESAQ
jgi:hypothetical protein